MSEAVRIESRAFHLRAEMHTAPASPPGAIERRRANTLLSASGTWGTTGGMKNTQDDARMDRQAS